jgi:putative transposase
MVGGRGGGMPRRAREFVEGGVYHVYNRVASGEGIFAEPETAIEFLELVREVKARDGWTVFAWCVMSNHYHLVLRTSAIPLSRSMHSIHSSFGHRFNRRFGRTGGVWQSRYQARLVDEGGYLGQVVVYVHLNPVKAGVERDLADDPFCGHREIVRRIASPLTDVDDALLIFGDSSRAARRAYGSSIRAGIEAIRRQQVEETLDPHSVSPWGDRMLEPSPGQEYVDELGRSSGRERGDLTAERFLELVCEYLGADVGTLGGRSKGRETVKHRRLVAALGVERWRQRCKDLGDVLGKNPDVVSYWVGEGARRRQVDPEFARLLDQLDEFLTNASESDVAAAQAET